MTSFLIAVILCFGMAMPVFANESGPGDSNEPITEGTEAAEAKAGITMVFKVAEGTEIPARMFEIAFTAKEVENVSVPEGKMPDVDPAYISFTANDIETAGAAEGGVVSVTKETPEDVFAGVEWPHAGVYVYTVEETDKTDAQIGYSSGKYDIYVYVANKAEEDGLFVEAIAARILSNDVSNAGAAPNAKVDATLGGGQGFSRSQLIFTNIYIQQVEETDPVNEVNSKLSIGVTVSGSYSDKTKYFDFLVDLKKPGTVSEETDYRGYVVEKINGEHEVVTSAENSSAVVTSTELGDFIEFTTGTTTEVKLRHGQQLVFTGIHDGASYIVTGKAAADYKASVKITENGVQGQIELSNNTTNEDRSTAPDNNTSLRRIINGAGNKADFNNEHKEVTPMGIGIDNLPYIILAIVTLTALVGYMTFMSRRNLKEED